LMFQVVIEKPMPMPFHAQRVSRKLRNGFPAMRFHERALEQRRTRGNRPHVKAAGDQPKRSQSRD
ncbi:hypothetical protein ACCS96_41670, partial [Rhizobium ruizarguesonis]